MLVGGGDVGRERRDRESVDRHRRRPRPFHAGESRRATSIARSKPRRRPACCARSSPIARHFVVHDPLPAAPQFGDEGAANHIRFTPAPGDAGRRALRLRPRRVRRRGAGAAEMSGAADRARRRPRSRAATASTRRARVFAQQNPDAIDAGVFHNDVIAVGHGDDAALSRAGVDRGRTSVLARAARAARRGLHADRRSRGGREPRRRRRELSLQQPAPAAHRRRALCSSRRPSAARTRASPRTSTRSSAAADRSSRLLAFDLRQSMRNGGGPACLRLAVDLTPAERAAIAARVFLDDALAGELDALDPPALPRPARAGRPRRSRARSTNRGARSTS